MGRAGTSCAPQRRSSTPAHDTERCAIRPEAGTRPRWRKKRRPSATWRWALQQLIHRGSGSTDSTNSSDPPLLGRRTLPLNCTCDFPVWRGGLRVHTSRFLAIRRAAASAWRPARACCARRAARRRFAAVGRPAACRRGSCRPAAVDPVRHACTPAAAMRRDGTDGRAPTSPPAAATRVHDHGQDCDSCLQHDRLRFDLFSLSCPRVRCVRPAEAKAARHGGGARTFGVHKTCKERTMLRGGRLHGPRYRGDATRAATPTRE